MVNVHPGMAAHCDTSPLPCLTKLMLEARNYMQNRFCYPCEKPSFANEEKTLSFWLSPYRPRCCRNKFSPSWRICWLVQIPFINQYLQNVYWSVSQQFFPKEVQAFMVHLYDLADFDFSFASNFSTSILWGLQYNPFSTHSGHLRYL